MDPDNSTLDPTEWNAQGGPIEDHQVEEEGSVEHCDKSEESSRLKDEVKNKATAEGPHGSQSDKVHVRRRHKLPIDRP